MPASRGTPTHIAPRTERWLPHAMIATAFVVVLPALAVWAIVPRGEAALLALSIPIGMLLSVLAGSVGGAVWKRVPGSRDIVFADLMLWGWLRRLRAERRLARAETLLGAGAEGLSVQALTNLSSLLEARDGYTYGHSQRVTRHAERIAAAMGLSTAEVAQVRAAAALHDVGKLHTPRDILNKPDRLTDEEFAVIKRHPSDGAAMAAGLGDPTITAIIRHHHERLDGGGYPRGLAGDAIPLGSRIIAVADTFDAMTSNRAYRRAASHKRALDTLRAEAGHQLDRDAVAAFVGYYRGRRTVAWSAFAMAAPQRLFAWLGGVTPGVSAGAAGAAAFAIGAAGPLPPAITPAAAAPRQAAERVVTAAAGDRPQPPTRAGVPVASQQRSMTRRDSSGTPRKNPRRKRTPSRTTPASKRNGQSGKPPRVKVEQVQPPPKVTPEKVNAPKAKPEEKAKPPKAKPPKPEPPKAKPPKPAPAKPKPPKPEPAKPKPPKPEAPKTKPAKTKPPKAPAPAPAPTVKPPKAPPPTATPPAAVPEPAKPPKAKLPKP